MSDTPARSIIRHALRVRSPDELVDFYCGTLGMQNYGTAKEPLLGFDKENCLLELHSTAIGPYTARPDDLYWKIGITLRDLDHAVEHLRERGCAVTQPRQFADIGYMSHLSDPGGFVIELLQQGFEGRAAPAGSGHPVGGQATLAHITLRVNDIAAARADLENRLGMRLISVQPVPQHGFCLYFFCWSGEAPPTADLEAVANREWLWARPYTLLELQHDYAGGVSTRTAADTDAGFVGFGWREGQDAGLCYLRPSDMRHWL